MFTILTHTMISKIYILWFKAFFKHKTILQVHIVKGGCRHPEMPVSYIPKSKLSNVRIPIHICGNVRFKYINHFTKVKLYSVAVNRRGTLRNRGLSKFFTPGPQFSGKQRTFIALTYHCIPLKFPTNLSSYCSSFSWTQPIS